MNKYTYYVIEEKTTGEGKTRYFSYAQKIHNCNNLLYAFKASGNNEIISVNACDTWKEAQEIARYWNECYENNGTYLFQKGA